MSHVEASHHAPYPPREGAPSLTLRELVHEIPGASLVDPASAEVRVSGVHHDSRRVEPGDLFVARAGARTAGERFIADAVERGAAAVLVARGAEVDTRGAPRLEADDVPRALAFAAAAVYGHPTFALEVIGITGTNGKTTTAHLVRAVIEACGGRAGIVGTLGYHFDDLSLAPTHTSPEADELARIAAAMRARGASHLVMEVSSIALAAKRAEAVRFRVVAFTNLTQDHLDYHGTMEAYGEAKARLFFDLAPGGAAVNVDDPFGAELARRLAPDSVQGLREAPLARYSARVGAPLEDAEIAPVALSLTHAGIDLTARTPAGEVTIRSPLLGAHNVSNLLTALSIAWLLDFDVAVAARALSQPIQVAGRLERCDAPGVDDVAVLVDYAHTPDALVRVLSSVQGLGRGRVVCVFGCGGDRDPGKRPLMGQAVGAQADVAIVTNDNPRSEDPQVIAEAILTGLRGGRAEIVVELDRRRAIERAVIGAEPGDVVLIAGKGHEPYQIIGDTTVPFDDRDEARRALVIRRSESGALMATPIPANRAAFTRAELVEATSGELIGAVDHVASVSTDTRAVTPGAAFVALRGEVHDGHAHLAAARAAGATLALVERDVAAPDGLALLRVRSTLTALGDLARLHARRWRAGGQGRTVLGITGSAGKTTTRVAVSALLERLFAGEVHSTQGNLNNRVGLPMVLFGLAPQHRIAVLEMGMNQPGEIAELCRLAEPDAGLCTLIAAAHTEGLGSMAAVSAEKGALYRALREDGLALGNADDARVRAELASSPARRRHLYGRAADADVRITAREPIGMTSSRVTLERASGAVTFTTPLLGEAGALACAAAVAVAELLLGDRVDGALCTEAFARADVGAGAGRLVPRVFRSGLAVIDDTYNANPASTCASIRAAAEIARATSRRLLLVLGEMRELGAESAPGHDEVGVAAAESGAAEVFAVGGGDAARIAARAAEGGLRAAHAAKVEDIAVLVTLAARPGDLVLVKGSRSIGTERVVSALAQDHDHSQAGAP